MQPPPGLRGATLDPGSKNRLVSGSARHFPESTLFGRFARAVCAAGCLPRKELFEAWEVAVRVHRRLSGRRVVDLACGHGALAWAMLLLDPSCPGALGIDLHLPPSAHRMAAVVGGRWPEAAARLQLEQGPLEEAALESGDLVVSVHACGGLTDRVLDLAIAAGAAVAVLPCCHDLHPERRRDLEGWVDGPLAMDLDRAQRLRAAGYRVWTATIPAAITPQNRLLVGTPREREEPAPERPPRAEMD